MPFQSATRDVLISTAKLLGEVSFLSQCGDKPTQPSSRPLTLRKAMTPSMPENLVQFLQRMPVVILLQEVKADGNMMKFAGARIYGLGKRPAP